MCARTPRNRSSRTSRHCRRNGRKARDFAAAKRRSRQSKSASMPGTRAAARRVPRLTLRGDRPAGPVVSRVRFPTRSSLRPFVQDEPFVIQSSDEEVLACQTLTNGHEAGGEPLVSGIGDERGVFQKNRERLLSFRSEAAQNRDIRMLRAIPRAAAPRVRRCRENQRPRSTMCFARARVLRVFR